MTGNKEKGQFYFVLALAIAVLLISIWAFMQEIYAAPQEDVVQRNMPGKEAGREKEKESTELVDTKTLIDTALSEITFETELTLMDDTVAESMITTSDDGTKIQLYMGEGTCSDELLVMTSRDSDSIKKEVENVQKHLTDMQQSFQDYLPKEAKKIDDAVILQGKNCIIACVSADKDRAKSILEEQLK